MITNVASGQSLRLFLVDGSPDGLLTADIINWTGRACVAPRSRIVQLLSRPEAQQTGIYILLGPDPDRIQGQLVYVGEGDKVGQRLRRHIDDEAMDFFDRVAIVVSKDENLTKAHARFLESELIRGVREAGLVSLINGTSPPTPALPEADRSDMAYFLNQIKMTLTILGFDLFKKKSTAAGAERPIFILQSIGLTALARETDEGFVVLKGAHAKSELSELFPPGYGTLREKLVAEGKLVPIGGYLEFTSNVAFSSSSAAAAIILGRSASGPREWKLQKTGETYKSWQSAALSEEGTNLADPLQKQSQD